MSNYPAGVTDGHPYFNTPDAPEYSYSDAVSWIDSDKHLGMDFSCYASENFPEIVDLFREQFHPIESAQYPDNDDFIGWHEAEFDLFLWTLLPEAKRRIIVHAFAESNWDEYAEFAS